MQNSHNNSIFAFSIKLECIQLYQDFQNYLNPKKSIGLLTPISPTKKTLKKH